MLLLVRRSYLLGVIMLINIEANLVLSRDEDIRQQQPCIHVHCGQQSRGAYYILLFAKRLARHINVSLYNRRPAVGRRGGFG